MNLKRALSSERQKDRNVGTLTFKTTASEMVVNYREKGFIHEFVDPPNPAAADLHSISHSPIQTIYTPSTEMQQKSIRLIILLRALANGVVSVREVSSF